MKRILVGYDGSEPSEHALARAAELAQLYGASLTVLTAAADRLVREDGVVTPALDEALGRRTAERGAEKARQLGAPQVEVRTSVEAPDDALVLEAREGGYDLVVVGHRGLGALRELFLGSTAKAVVDRVECSVLVVR